MCYVLIYQISDDDLKNPSVHTKRNKKSTHICFC